MNRGDRRQAIYLDDVDRQDFLKTLAEACQKTGWQIHADCLMGNHFAFEENQRAFLRSEPSDGEPGVGPREGAGWA